MWHTSGYFKDHCSLFNLPIAMMDGLSNYNAHKYTQWTHIRHDTKMVETQYSKLTTDDELLQDQ